MNHQMDKANAYDQLTEEYQKIEKEKIYFEEKCKKQKSEMIDLKALLAKKEAVEKNVEDLRKERDALEKKFQTNMIELNRLRVIEEKCNRLDADCIEKERQILVLLDKVSDLEVQLSNANEKYNTRQSQLKYEIEQLTCENAAFQNEISSLKAQLWNLKNEHQEILNELNAQLSEATKSNEELQKELLNLQNQNKEKTQKIEHLEAETQGLKAIKNTMNKDLQEVSNKLEKCENDLNNLIKDSENKAKQYEAKVN
jgi:chromosome segregation ATPase